MNQNVNLSPQFRRSTKNGQHFKHREQTGNQMSRIKGCIFSRVLNQGDHADREAIMGLLNSGKTNIDIARTMTDVGVPMSEHAVRRHRKNDCSCGWL
jgi:ferritin-like metal-binding protein YciE